MTRRIAWAGGALAFLVLATANSGGYRYGVSDQAFYQPAVVRALDPTLFPNDAPLLEAQTRLMLADEILAATARATGLGLPALFAAFYVVSVVALLGAATSFARALRLSPWALAAFVLLLTLKHRIARTGANSLEGYAHPRMLAFALGVAALACVVRGRTVWAWVCLGVAGMLHPTSAVWFGIAVAAALVASRPDRLRRAGLALVAGAVVATWGVAAGPLAGRLRIMDADWLAVLATKDYLFPVDWPAWAWALNLSYVGVIVIGLRLRERLGESVPGERALVAGLIALFAVWVISVPATWLKVALAVQLQVTRVFWVLDVVAMAYIAWVLTSWLSRLRLGIWAPRIAVLVLALASAARGIYILTLTPADRQLVRVDLPDTPWVDTLRWIRAQPERWNVLADPDHGWKYGVSVRVGAERDTVLEAGKDSALAMYDRAVAMRVADGLATLGLFDEMTPARARTLASRYRAQVMVGRAQFPLDLPALYRNAEFVVYDLR